MAFNGSGGWSLPAGQPVVTGTVISSTTQNVLVADIQTSFGMCVVKDGQQTITANLPMATFRHTGVGAAVALTDYARYDQVQNGAPALLASVSGTNTITGTASPTPAAYARGQVFRFDPAVTNTGATTLNVSSLGAGAVQLHGAALAGGELRAGVPVEVFVSTNTPVFQVVNPAVNTVLLTEVNTTSATLHDFTIPSGARRITIMLNGVSLSGATELAFRLGDAGGVETAGYNGASAQLINAGAVAAANPTSFWRTVSSNAAATFSGVVTIVAQNYPLAWTCFGVLSRSDTATMDIFSGSKSLSAALTTVQILSADGVSTFDAGFVNVSYEF